MATINSIGTPYPLDIEDGGTDTNTLTNHGVLVGSGTTAITATAVGATNEVLIGNTGVDPGWGTVGNAALTNSSITLSDGNNITVTGSPVSLGGTASFNLTGTTQYAVQVGDATGSLGSLAVGATGETIMGSTGADPGWTGSPSFSGSVTAGTGLTVTAGNAAISAGNLTLTNTNTAGTSGEITFGGNRFISNYGDYNTFIGENSGNTTLSITAAEGEANVGIGYNALISITKGDRNCFIGRGAADELTEGRYNLGLGDQVMTSITTGSANTGIGSAALRVTTGIGNTTIGAYDLANGSGYAYTTSESYNIVFANPGTIGESNKIRIGVNGSGAYQQDACYIAGIYGVTPAGTKNIAYIDSNHQLGSVASITVANGGTGAASITDHSLIVGSGAAAVTELGVATNGQIPIGSSAADPVLSTITAGTGITVTNAAGSITITNTSTGALTLNNQTGTTYTLVLTDAGKLVTLTNAAAITLTVPKNASVAFDIGTQILLYQGGAGTVTVAPVDGDVTINSADDLLDLYAQYSTGSLVKILTDTWVFSGDIA